MLPDRFLFTGAGARRGPRRVLPLGRRLRLAQRARGVLRAAGRGDGGRRAGAGLRRRRGARKRSAAPACCSRRRISSSPPRCSGTLVYDRSVRDGVLEGQRRRLARLRARPRIERAAATSVLAAARIARSAYEDRVHRPALRHRDPRRVGVPLPADRRAPGAAPPGRGADDLRRRLHHLEERVPGRAPTASAASPSAGSPTRSTRDIQAFNRYSEWIFNNPHTRDDEIEWLRQQGPWCPALLEYLERNHHQYDVLIFFTYLYAPTVLGVRIAPHKTILVPTAHDEPAIHLEIYKELFSLPAGMAYNTEVERRFLTTHFSIRADRGGDRRLRRRPAAGAGRIRASAGPSRRAATAGRRRPRTTPAPDEASPTLPAAPGAPRRDLPAPAPAARAVRALRRPHRSGQGLRGADRVLQHLRAGRRATRRWC